MASKLAVAPALRQFVLEFMKTEILADLSRQKLELLLKIQSKISKIKTCREVCPYPGLSNGTTPGSI
jgi:hypothetical protein